MTAQPDPNAISCFSQEYERMNEEELLHLAASYDSLVEPAQTALRGEFERRKMEPPLIDNPDGWDEVTAQKLVTIRRYRDLSEAMVGRTILESAGIFCFMRDENVVRMDWFYSNAVGGIRLEVRPEDTVAAEELLSQSTPVAIEYESEKKYVQPHCPRCGSIDITFEGRDRSAALVSTTMLSLPLPLGEESWRCHACDCVWADDEDGTDHSAKQTT
jgi:predicted RNA-binding Zn-ribbon protein involved in translation (DUF1610 family)